MELDVLDTPTPTPPLVSPAGGAGVREGAGARAGVVTPAMATVTAAAPGFLVGEPGLAAAGAGGGGGGGAAAASDAAGDVAGAGGAAGGLGDSR